MAYKFTNLGFWEKYVPNPAPDGFPAGAVFARRDSDGADWYSFSQAQEFSLSKVYATAFPVAAGNVVMAIQRDISMLFPGGCLLIEIEGVPENEEFPHKLFEQQNYNPADGTIMPFPPAAGSVITYKREMWARMTDAEANVLDADLMEQSAKIRRQFQDAQYIDHSDPLFTMMQTAIAGHFGTERAAVILAPSKVG